MDFITHFIQQGFSYLGPFFILLGLLIFVHEFGHFLIAKYCGVRVEIFSLGFGKKILQLKRGDTNYCISLIPLGGYVKMFGDDPNAEISEKEKQFSFLHKKVGQRIAIVLAGPLMNLIFAAVLFTGIAMIGQQVPAPILGDITSDSKAFAAGFRSGDQINSINETAVNTWNEIKKIIQQHPGDTLTFKIQNPRTGVREFEATPSLITNDDIFSWTKKVGGFEGLSTLSKAPLVGVPNSHSLAAKAGLQSLDLITKINEQEISYWRELEYQLFTEARKNKDIVLTVKSYVDGEDSEPREVLVKDWNPTSIDSAASELGLETTELYLLKIIEDSPAEQAGLQRGDKVISLRRKPVTTWNDILNRVKSFKESQEPLEFVILRKGQIENFSIQPEVTKQMNRQHQDEKRFTVGIVPALISVGAPPVTQITSNPIKALHEGVEQSIHWTNLVIISLIRLVKNEISPRNISSVITIGKVAGQSFQIGISPFLKVMAIISINLFLINLLPIPMLDGGHLMFFTIEAVRGAPISMKKMEIAQQIGLVIMMTLMAYALFNDIANLFNPPW